MTQIFKHVELFKDFKLKETWKAPWDDQWDVEVKGRKARIHSCHPFTRKPSRFNTLSYLGGYGEMRIYGLIVNGKKAYFAIPYGLS